LNAARNSWQFGGLIAGNKHVLWLEEEIVQVFDEVFNGIHFGGGE
jgi:hypothetical protein